AGAGAGSGGAGARFGAGAGARGEGAGWGAGVGKSDGSGGGWDVADASRALARIDGVKKRGGNPSPGGVGAWVKSDPSGGGSADASVAKELIMQRLPSGSTISSRRMIRNSIETSPILSNVCSQVAHAS